MLYSLVGISFALGMQVSKIPVSEIRVSGMQASTEEGYMPSQEDLAHATQQAAKLQIDANKLIDKNLLENFFKKDHPKKGCPSQLMEGRSHLPGKDQTKGCLKSKAPATPQKEKGNQILIFVSFAMPEASLKSLAQEAQRISTQRDASQRVSTQQHNAVLVMRGLYQDSFVKTAKKLQDLGITVDINPELFETHQVTSVPTFVQLKDGQPLHSLKGNVTLRFAAEKFENQLADSQRIEDQSFEGVS